MAWGEIFTPLLTSLKIALVATAFVFVAGTLAARLLTRSCFPGKDLLEGVLTLPLLLPPTVTGFLLLLLLGRNGPLARLTGTNLLFTWQAGVVAAAVVAFPLMYNSAKAGLEQVDETLEKAARTLGAGELRVFLTVTLPLAWPGLLSGLVLSFTRAVGEFGATLMVAGAIPGRTQTVAVAIYLAAERGDLATASALVIITLVFGLTTVGALTWWSRQRQRYRAAGTEKARSRGWGRA